MNEQVETQVNNEEVDRKELLAQQFDAAERAEPNAPTGRDERGRFARPANEQVAEQPVEQPALRWATRED